MEAIWLVPGWPEMMSGPCKVDATCDANVTLDERHKLVTAKSGGKVYPIQLQGGCLNLSSDRSSGQTNISNISSQTQLQAALDCEASRPRNKLMVKMAR